jgi:hypothetical protein
LRYSDFTKSFFLHTDAFGTGLGAVLAQRDQENKEYAVAYASRSLTKAERNYAATELECLAVVWAVEHFHQYLGTTPFLLITDHSALKWLKTTELKGRQARWIMRLEPYNYTIIHRAGRKHNNADAMSRMYETEEPIYFGDIEEEMDFDPTNPEGHIFEIGDFVSERDEREESKKEDNQECQTRSEWFIAGQYCHVCQERAEDHHTHKMCINCNRVNDKNTWPFKDNCICKGKQRMKTPEPSEWSNDFKWEEDSSESIEIIMDNPPRNLQRKTNSQPITTLDNTYWWLPKLQQPSQEHINEFNNFSEKYLCNSIWWEITNPTQYL